MASLVMGVLNVTPDSFSDGGRWLDHRSAIARGQELFAEGADVVDVGGESTRPGAQPVSADEEIGRVVPVVEALSELGRVSVDTMKAEVARAAIGAGATLVNDVSASLDPVAAELGVGWCAMHMQGEPRTMQRAPRYDDVVAEVHDYLLARAEAAVAAGVREVWIDPGIGFGKTVDHNLSLLRHLDRLVSSPFPVLVGTSRKSFIGKLLGGSGAPAPVEERVEASIASAVLAVSRGARMVRVHDVAGTVRALRLTDAVLGAA